MTKERSDEERLAALLDGRLGPRERADVINLLGSSPHALEAFADAAAVLEELGLESSPTEISRQPAFTKSWRPRSTRVVWMGFAAAAALTLIAVVPRLMHKSSRGDLPPAETIVLGLGRDDAALAASLNATPWSVSRGSAGGCSALGCTVRAGMLLVDLEVLARSGRTEAAQTAQQVGTLLDSVPGGFLAGRAFHSLAHPIGVSALADMGSAIRNAERYVDPRALRSGAWLRAALIATARADTSFFNRVPIDGALSDLLTAARGDREALASIARLQTIFAERSRNSSAAVSDALTAVVNDLRK
jgi:hypothetical protein